MLDSSYWHIICLSIYRVVKKISLSFLNFIFQNKDKVTPILKTMLMSKLCWNIWTKRKKYNIDTKYCFNIYISFLNTWNTEKKIYITIRFFIQWKYEETVVTLSMILVFYKVEKMILWMSFDRNSKEGQTQQR